MLRILLISFRTTTLRFHLSVTTVGRCWSVSSTRDWNVEVPYICLILIHWDLSKIRQMFRADTQVREMATSSITKKFPCASCCKQCASFSIKVKCYTNSLCSTLLLKHSNPHSSPLPIHSWWSPSGQGLAGMGILHGLKEVDKSSYKHFTLLTIGYSLSNLKENFDNKKASIIKKYYVIY